MRGLRRNEKQARNDARAQDAGGTDRAGCDGKEERTRRLSVQKPGLPEKARKNRGLERSFQMSIPDEVYDSLEKEFGESETE